MDKSGNTFPSFHAVSPTCWGIKNLEFISVMAMQSLIIADQKLTTSETAEKAVNYAKDLILRLTQESY